MAKEESRKKYKGKLTCLFDGEDDKVANGQMEFYGNVIKSGSAVLETLGSFKMLSVSPVMDIALGGGIREGTVVNITGDPKVGKTTTALHFAAKCQNAGKKVVFVNTEGRLEMKNFLGIKGLNIEDIRVVESDGDSKLSAEDFLNIIEGFIREQPDVVIIVDSLSVLVPREELNGEVRGGVRNQLPRLLAMFFKRISGDIARTRSVLMCITHNIADSGPSRRTKMADCGNMLQYQISTNMVATHRIMTEPDKGNVVGQECHWDIKTSSCGKPTPGVISYITYGIGIDEAQEIARVAIDFRLIKNSGAWYKISHCIENLGEPCVKRILAENGIETAEGEELTKAKIKDIERVFNSQGMGNLTKFFNENEDVQKFIYNEIVKITNDF